MEAQPSFPLFLQLQTARVPRIQEVEPSSNSNSRDFQMSSDLILLPTSLIAIAGIIMVLLGLNLKKNVRDRLSTIQQVKQMPCANCRFFKNNPYLKCAVQPAKVLTSQAHNCQDYQDLSGHS